MQQITKVYLLYPKEYSSVGRASVSKTEGQGFDPLCSCFFIPSRSIAQLVERRSPKPKAKGSIPFAPAFSYPFRSIAQLVERRSPKPKIKGSIPFAPAFIIYFNGGAI